MRGLLHDLGHEMTTLSYLVEALRGDAALPDEATARLEVLALELSRMLDMVISSMPDGPGEAVEAVDLRSLASRVAQLAQVAHDASVALAPGPPIRVEASPSLVWRVLANVVDNAARAAAPRGRVEIAVTARERRPDAAAGAVIEVTDDGPGFGQGPPGTSAMGLTVAASLLDSCGGRFTVDTPEEGGTRVRITLPGEAPASAGASGQAGAWSP